LVEAVLVKRKARDPVPPPKPPKESELLDISLIEQEEDRMRLNSSQSRRAIRGPQNQNLQRMQTFREKFRSIDERHRDYTLMTKINAELAHFKDQPICSDCFK
jgi:hypothetical protein